MSAGCLVAEDGEQALQAARDHPEIRVVLLDVVMRGLSGKELVDQLRINLPNAAILFCSGHPPENDEASRSRPGLRSFHPEALFPPELQRRIEELLSIR